MAIKSIDYSLELPKAEVYLATPSRAVIGKLDKHIYNLDIITKLRDLSQITFNVPIELDINNELVSHPLLSRIKEGFTLRLDYNGETTWFKITKLTKSSDDTKNEYVVQAYSLATELNQKKVLDLDVSSYNCTQIMNVALSGTKWTIGTIDPQFNLMYRDFTVTNKTSLEFILNDIVQAFTDGTSTLAQFDTVNRTVSIIKESSIEVDYGLRVVYEKYMSGVNQEKNTDTHCTRLYCVGNNSLTINRTNPNGLSFIDDFSYYLAPYTTDVNGKVLISSDYFSDSLSQAVVNYNNLLAAKSPLTANATTGTTTTTLVITNHGLATGDYIVNRTHGRETRSVTVVDANTLTLSSAITGQASGDEILKYPDGTFGKLLFQLEDLQATLQTQENDLDTLKTQKLSILDQLAIQAKASTYDSYVGVISNTTVTRTLSSLLNTDDYVGMAYVSNTASTTVSLNGVAKPITANTWTVLGKMTGSTSYNIAVTTTASNITVKTMIVKITNAEYTATGNESTIINTYCDDNKQIAIDAKQSQIDSTNASITSKNTDISNMRTALSYESNFTTEELDELTDYIYEDEYSNDNIVDDKDLYDYGKTELVKRNSPTILYKTDIVDFMQSITEQLNWNKLVLGSIITIIHPKLNINAKAKILEIDHSIEEATITLTIGDNKEVLSKKDRVMKQLYNSHFLNKELLKKKQVWDITKLNFDNRNDRLSATPNNPVVATDGTAIDHTVNANGSVDITFEWSYNDYNTTHADADNIDGFYVYTYSSDRNNKYVIGSTNDTIDIQTRKPTDRYIALLGVAANKYYTFGVQAFRIVDQDIASDGILKSNIVQSSASGENPYQPLSNPAYTGDWLGTIGGTAYDAFNKISATITVSSQDYSKNYKNANYIVPSGSTSAQNIINAAISSLGSVGGKVVLMEGTYTISNSILLTSNVQFEGQSGSTVIKFNSNFPINTPGITNNDHVNGNDGISVRSILIDGNKSNQPQAPTINDGLYGIRFDKTSNLIIESCKITNVGGQQTIVNGSPVKYLGYGLYIYNCSNTKISNNTIQNCAGDGVELLNTNYSNITNNIIDSVWNGIVNIGSGNNVAITGNTISNNNGTGISPLSYNVVSGNVIYNHIKDTGISAQSIVGATISSNNITYCIAGIALSNANSNTVVSNTCEFNYQYGIRIYNSKNNIVNNNYVDSNNQSNNGFSNISISTTSNNNNIQGNICREGSGTYKPVYGINIETSDCSGNIVANNDLLTSGTSGSFLDGGTGTITTSANRL